MASPGLRERGFLCLAGTELSGNCNTLTCLRSLIVSIRDPSTGRNSPRSTRWPRSWIFRVCPVSTTCLTVMVSLTGSRALGGTGQKGSARHASSVSRPALWHRSPVPAAGRGLGRRSGDATEPTLPYRVPGWAGSNVSTVRKVLSLSGGADWGEERRFRPGPDGLVAVEAEEAGVVRAVVVGAEQPSVFG